MSFYLANSHRETYHALWAPHEADEFVWTSDIRDAEIVLFPHTTPDPGAPFPLRKVPVNAHSRLYTFATNDDPFIWAPGLYTSVPRSRAGAGIRGGFYIVPHQEGPTGLSSFLEPKADAICDRLWSFVGSIESAPHIRGPLLQLNDERSLAVDATSWSRPAVEREARLAKTFDDYAHSIHRAKFVVCPRGKGPGSIRLFESMQAARCPIIISDEWLAPSGVDWAACSITIPEAQIKWLPEILRERENEANALGQKARQEWRNRFSPGRRLATLAQNCLEIHETLPRSQRVSLAARAAVSRPGLRQAKVRVRRDLTRLAARPPSLR